MMSKRVYVRMARLLASERTQPLAASCTAVLDRLTREIADMFADDNPRFRRETFYRAAKLPPESE